MAWFQCAEHSSVVVLMRVLRCSGQHGFGDQRFDDFAQKGEHCSGFLHFPAQDGDEGRHSSLGYKSETS
jgi:hypothetical protein